MNVDRITAITAELAANAATLESRIHLLQEQLTPAQPTPAAPLDIDPARLDTHADRLNALTDAVHDLQQRFLKEIADLSDDLDRRSTSIAEHVRRLAADHAALSKRHAALAERYDRHTHNDHHQEPV